MRSLDLTGLRFGTLTVNGNKISRRALSDGRSEILWECICVCGVKREVKTEHLRSGNTTSCGSCSKRGNKRSKSRLPTETAAINSIQSQYICRARRLGQEYTLTREQFVRLISVPCYYCGDSNTANWTRRGRAFRYTGIDRVDSSRGYITGNVVPCCTYCNRGKSNQPLSGFLDRVRRIYERHILVQDGKEALRDECKRLGLW